MYKMILSLMLSFLALNGNSIAKEIRQPLCALYIVPENPCDYVTGGSPFVINESGDRVFGYYFSDKNKTVLSIECGIGSDDFSCQFGAPYGQDLKKGTYENADHGFRYSQPHLIFCGFNHGYNSSIGEFEILEIERDKMGNLLSFAADFKLYSDGKPENLVRGAVRYNSLVPVDEYFISKVRPTIDIQSQHLLYVRKTHRFSGEKETILYMDSPKLHVTLERHNSLFLTAGNADISCPRRSEITIRTGKITQSSSPSTFKIEKRINIEFDDEFEDFIYDDYNDALNNPQAFIEPRIYLRKSMFIRTTAEKGEITLYEAAYDIRNDRISLAVDFSFQDELGDFYEGYVRYNSTTPVFFE